MGGRIRRLRHARGLTLVQLADLAELSHPFLSQLERGLARPSFGSLEKIARALGSSQLELLADDDAVVETSVSVVRAGAGTRGHYADGEGRMLVHGRRAFHPMESAGDNLEFGDSFVHDEDEFVYVLSGGIEAELGGGDRYRLELGDSLYFAGGTPHRWRALDGSGYRLLIVKETPARL